MSDEDLRRIDTLVAERIFGKHLCDQWEQINLAGGTALQSKCGCALGTCYPALSDHPLSGPQHYTTDGNAMLALIAKMQEGWRLWLWLGSDEGSYTCEWSWKVHDSYGPEKVTPADREALPEAIARAALTALGVALS